MVVVVAAPCRPAAVQVAPDKQAVKVADIAEEAPYRLAAVEEVEPLGVVSEVEKLAAPAVAGAVPARRVADIEVAVAQAASAEIEPAELVAADTFAVLATVVTELDALVAVFAAEAAEVGAEEVSAAGAELVVVVIETLKNTVATVVVFDLQNCRSAFVEHIADFVEPDCCCSRRVAVLAAEHIVERQPAASTSGQAARPAVELQLQGLEPAQNNAQPLLEPVVDSFEPVPVTVQELSGVGPVFAAAGQGYWPLSPLPDVRCPKGIDKSTALWSQEPLFCRICSVHNKELPGNCTSLLLRYSFVRKALL